MRIIQSTNSFLWFIVDKNDKIVRVAHSRDEAEKKMKEMREK